MYNGSSLNVGMSWGARGGIRRLRLEERIPNPKAKQIFAAIRRHGTVSKAELIKESGMTVSTLSRVLDDLIARGLIEEVGYGASTGEGVPFVPDQSGLWTYIWTGHFKNGGQAAFM